MWLGSPYGWGVWARFLSRCNRRWDCLNTCECTAYVAKLVADVSLCLAIAAPTKLDDCILRSPFKCKMKLVYNLRAVHDLPITLHPFCCVLLFQFHDAMLWKVSFPVYLSLLCLFLRWPFPKSLPWPWGTDFPVSISTCDWSPITIHKHKRFASSWYDRSLPSWWFQPETKLVWRHTVVGKCSPRERING